MSESLDRPPLSTSLTPCNFNELSPDEINYVLGTRSLLSFIQKTKPDYIADEFHVKLCEILERFQADVQAKKRPRVIISAPPQHGKSEIVSRRFPAWSMGLAPDMRVIAGSYASSWAEQLSQDVQRTMTSEEYSEVFPATCIKDGFRYKSLDVRGRAPKRTADYFEVGGRRGFYRAAGRGVGVTGRSADILLIDDPIKNAEEALSETTRESVWQWYSQDLYTRLQMGAGVIVMATRWHLDDLIGRLLAAQRNPGADQWEVHNFQALETVADDQGEPTLKALCPSRYSVQELKNIKANQPDIVWSALYQGSPVALDGGLLPADKWKFYGAPGQPSRPDLRQFDQIVATWDGAFKDSVGSDFCCGQVWGLRGAEYWLLDYILEKMSYLRFKSAIQQMSKKWPQTSFIFIEEKANGAAVISELRTVVRGIVAVVPKESKIARAWAASSDVAAGNCFLPDSSTVPFDVGGFVHRCAVFPANINKPGSDDDIDAFTQMVNETRKRVLGLATYYKEEQQKLDHGPVRPEDEPTGTLDDRPIKYDSIRGLWIFTDTGEACPQD